MSAAAKGARAPGAAADTGREKEDFEEGLSAVQEMAVEPIAEEESGSLFGSGCKWPVGHPGEEDFRFCGNPRQAGLPYCEEHAKEAYQPVDRRRGGSRQT